jgi:DNA (cytosine-5)-methyltransferase 1
VSTWKPSVPPVSRPLVLDLYCCQGAASKGYELAGFEVAGGVDKFPQPLYPYPFIKMDAIEYLKAFINGLMMPNRWERRVKLIHAAPPCQAKTKCQKIQKREHPKLIADTRELLVATGLPYVIENVVPENRALDDDPLKDPITLCGAMFPGLNTYRHREFESNMPITAPPHTWRDGPTVKMGRPLVEGDWYHAVGHFSGVPYVKANMGVPWMTRDGISECTPPVYTEFIGRQVLKMIEGGAA